MRWLLLLLLAILALILVSYFEREQLEHVVIAYKIHQAHVFTPPAADAGESQLHRFWADAQFYWDLAEVRIARDKRVKELNPELQSLLAEVNRRQDAGENMDYSMHIYREIRWRLNFTSNVQVTRARIEDLRQSLKQPELQKQADEQQASDGSWGMGINEWYLRLYYSVDEIKDKLHGKIPPYPLSKE